MFATRCMSAGLSGRTLSAPVSSTMSFTHFATRSRYLWPRACVTRVQTTPEQVATRALLWQTIFPCSYTVRGDCMYLLSLSLCLCVCVCVCVCVTQLFSTCVPKVSLCGKPFKVHAVNFAPCVPRVSGHAECVRNLDTKTHSAGGLKHPCSTSAHHVYPGSVVSAPFQYLNVNTPLATLNQSLRSKGPSTYTLNPRACRQRTQVNYNSMQ